MRGTGFEPNPDVLAPLRASGRARIRSDSLTPADSLRSLASVQCVGPDLNRRTSTGQRPQRCAVGLAWLPTPGLRTARTARSRSDLTLSVPYLRASRPAVPGFLHAPLPTGLPHPQTDNMRPGDRPRCPPNIPPRSRTPPLPGGNGGLKYAAANEGYGEVLDRRCRGRLQRRLRTLRRR